MNIRFILIMAIATICTVACKKGKTDDPKTDEPKTVVDLSGTYTGYTDANCSFFEHYYTNDEKLVATAKGDSTLSIFFDSSTWGKFEVSSAAIAKKNDNEYTFYGVGEVAMSMMGAMAGMYGFEMLGTVNATKDKYSVYIKVPAVMGGLTIVLLPGKAPKQDTDKQ